MNRRGARYFEIVSNSTFTSRPITIKAAVSIISTVIPLASRPASRARAITMPAMTKLGYPKRLAAAVEAVASSGGQIMPPLMGAGAFVMVELTGVPYTQIMAAALFPAILYFAAVWIGVDAYATRYDLKGIPPEQAPIRFRSFDLEISHATAEALSSAST